MSEVNSDPYTPDEVTGMLHICTGDIDPNYDEQPFRLAVDPNFVRDRIRDPNEPEGSDVADSQPI